MVSVLESSHCACICNYFDKVVPPREMRALSQSCRKRCAGPSDAKNPSDTPTVVTKKAICELHNARNLLAVPAIRIDIVADSEI